jgi:acetyl-CoA C-acetyltransferase
MIAAEPLGFKDPFSGSQGWVARYGDVPVSQFNSAQMIADKWNISREQMEAYALESHTRALKAMEQGRFDREVVPMNGVEMDETARNTSMEKMAELEPLAEGGTITAAVSSQTCDGSSAMLPLQPDPPGPYPPHERTRGGPDLDADGADPGHGLCDEEGGYETRGYRPGGNQRGVCFGADGLVAGNGLSPRED